MEQTNEEIARLAQQLGPIISDANEIDRKLHAKKKRPRVDDKDTENVLSIANMKTGDSWGDGRKDEEAHFWKERFQRLRKEKSKELQALEADLAGAIQKEESAAKACALLEGKIRALEAGDGADVSVDKLAEQRRLLAFYELMTSMVVKVAPQTAEGGAREEYVCIVKNPLQRQAVQFTIANTAHSSSSSSSGDSSVTDAGGESDAPGVEFVPMANMDMLPEYLRATISCERDYCPVIIGDVLAALHQDDADQEG